MADVNNVNKVDAELKDQFGRTDAERTVILSPEDFEQVMLELNEGSNHDTYMDALAYQLERGRCEIRRQRETAAKQDAQRKDAKSMAKFNELIGRDPKLLQNHKALVMLLKSHGAYTGNIKTLLASFGITEEEKPKAVPAVEVKKVS